jgi:DNA end-binding protein Ku
MGVSWKGSISFGLIYIPISLTVATRDDHISFNMLHEKCHNRIKYKKICDYCDEEVKTNDIIKGYQYEENKYVIFNDDDLEKIKTEKDKSINIVQFVDLSEIDTVFYDKSYYVVPSGGERAFELLKQAMSETNKVGIAKVVFGSKESLVALRVDGDKMVLNKLFFADEIQHYQAPYASIEVNQGEVDLAKQLIGNLTKPFQPEVFHDEYNERVKHAIEEKIQGKEISEPVEATDNNIINLMEALQESLKATEGPRV